MCKNNVMLVTPSPLYGETDWCNTGKERGVKMTGFSVIRAFLSKKTAAAGFPGGSAGLAAATDFSGGAAVTGLAATAAAVAGLTLFAACEQSVSSPNKKGGDVPTGTAQLKTLELSADPPGGSVSLIPQTFAGSRTNYVAQYDGKTNNIVIKLTYDEETVTLDSVDYEEEAVDAGEDGTYTVAAANSREVKIKLKDLAGGSTVYSLLLASGAAGGELTGMRKVTLSGTAPNYTIAKADTAGAYFAYIAYKTPAGGAKPENDRLLVETLSSQPLLVGPPGTAQYATWTQARDGSIAINAGSNEIAEVYVGAKFYYEYLYDKGEIDKQITANGTSQSVLQQIQTMGTQMTALTAQITAANTNITGIEADITAAEGNITALQAQLAGIGTQSGAVKALTDSLQTLITGPGGINERITDIDGRITGGSSGGGSGGSGGSVALPSGLLTAKTVTVTASPITIPNADLSGQTGVYALYADGSAETVKIADLTVTPAAYGPEGAAAPKRSMWKVTAAANGDIEITQADAANANQQITALWLLSPSHYNTISPLLTQLKALKAELAIKTTELAGHTSALTTLSAWKRNTETDIAALTAKKTELLAMLTDWTAFKLNGTKTLAQLESSLAALTTGLSAANGRIDSLLASSGVKALASSATTIPAADTTGALKYHFAYVTFADDTNALIKLAALDATAQYYPNPAGANTQSQWVKAVSGSDAGKVTITAGTPAITGIYLGQEALYGQLDYENRRFGTINANIGTINAGISWMVSNINTVEKFNNQVMIANYAFSAKSAAAATAKYVKLATVTIPAAAQAAGLRNVRGAVNITQSAGGAQAVRGYFNLETASTDTEKFGAITDALLSLYTGTDGTENMNLGYVIKDSAAPPELQIWAQSDKSEALADLKIEIAKNAGGAPLTVTCHNGAGGAAWETTKPANYAPFDKTVTGALSLPVKVWKDAVENGWKVYGTITGNVVNINYYNTLANNGNPPNGTIPAEYRPGTDISVNVIGETGSGAGFDIKPDGTYSSLYGGGRVSAFAGTTVTYIVNNVAAAHLVADPPVDFSAEITGSTWTTDATDKIAMYSRTTGLVQIQFRIPQSKSYTDASRVTIPAKYRPVYADITFGTMTWTGYSSARNTNSYIKKADGKVYLTNDGALDYVSSGALSSPCDVTFTYYIAPEAGAYVIAKPNMVEVTFGGNAWHNQTMQATLSITEPAFYYIHWESSGNKAITHTLPGGGTSAQSGNGLYLLSPDDKWSISNNNGTKVFKVL